MTRREHLVDRLDGAAEVAAPGPAHVGVQPMTIGRDRRTALFQHPDSTVAFPGVLLGSHPVLRLALGIKEAAWDRLQSEVLFAVAVRSGPEGAETPLFCATLDPRSREGDRRWVEHAIDLGGFAHATVTLVFRTSVPEGGDARWAWAGWADPTVEHDAVAHAPARRPPPPPLVLLITADALRADHLGCYGHPRVKTPHLDRLAADGVLFEHARAQSPATLPSYASLLTGLHVPRHGITAEWGHLPGSLLTLPVLLGAHGYDTFFAPSEWELGEADLGFGDRFGQTIACLGSPAQDGSLTTRRVLSWLERRPARPAFLWVQYFDTHPPTTPPDPWRRAYYPGNPTDPASRHHPEEVAAIHGIESVAELEQGLRLLAEGVVDACVTERLARTADALRGVGRGTAPDLAPHLRALGAEAMRGLAPPELGAWLAVRSAALRAGHVEPDLVAWLRDLVPRLRVVEREILSWLDGVVDARYPVAQYAGAVSYLDEQVGTLLAALRDEGTYDRSTVLFASPHGELFGERGVHFHHHTLLEGALRVPAILKPATGRARPGTRVGGVLDLVDLLPTLLDALDIAPPVALDGVSRWANARSGAPIPAHASFAVGNHAMLLAIARGRWKLIAVRGDHALSVRCRWVRGERLLFDLEESPLDETDRRADEPATAAALAAELEAWARGWERRLEPLSRPTRPTLVL